MLRRKTAAYALLALYEIAKQQGDQEEGLGVRAQDIAQKHRLPKAYAAKILSQLANHGILRSDRGPRGGFRLNRPCEDISLFDVFEGVGAILFGQRTDNAVPDLPPNVQDAMSRADREGAEALRHLFRRTTLADVVGRESVTA